MALDWRRASAPTNTVITKHFASIDHAIASKLLLPICITKKWLVLMMSLHGMMVRNIVSAKWMLVEQ